MARRKNKPPVATGRATGKHAAKTQEERQEYKHHVTSTPGPGETVVHPTRGQEDISAPADIQSSAVPVGGGDMRRIELPAPPVPAGSFWRKSVLGVLTFIGFGGLLGILGGVRQCSRFEERVDNTAQSVKELGERTTQNVKELGDRQDKEKDRVDGFVERLAKLEVQVDIAVRSGDSTAALAAEVASLRQALGAQQTQHGVLDRRIEAVEARLVSVGTEPRAP